MIYIYSSISCEDLKKIIGRADIIDIRPNYLYNLSSIPCSKNIPKNYLLMNPEKYLDKNKKYYIYCTFGIESASICNKLNKEGYNLVNILGGFNSYN